MSAATILTLANGKGVDLLDLRVEDVDFTALAEHLGKEKRFNGATPDTEYSVAQHLCLGSDAILKAGGTELEAAEFHIHDCQEGIWKDDPTPKKVAIAERIAQRCGVLADDILERFICRRMEEILTNAVKDDDGIVDRETEDDEKCRDEESVHFIA